MEKKSTYGLRLDQMAGLFAIGSGDANPVAERGDDEILRDLLHKQLTSVEPTGSLLRETLVMMIDRTGGPTGALADRPLGEILLDPQSDIELLDAIKEAAKTLSCTLDSRTETALAKTVYFAAIASALVHHDRKITQHPSDTLAESLAQLMKKQWMASELVALFARAKQMCASRSDEA